MTQDAMNGPTTPLKRDWLLNGARVLTIIVITALIAGLVIVGLALVAVLFAMLFASGQIISQLAAEGIPGSMIWAIAGILAVVALALWCFQDFMRQLLKVINSVGEGQPFAPENARRLKRMGWLSIAGQLTALPLAALGVAIAEAAKDAPEKITVLSDFGVDFGSILLTLILFILARVFERGNQLEAEMEGTV